MATDMDRNAKLSASVRKHQTQDSGGKRQLGRHKNKAPDLMEGVPSAYSRHVLWLGTFGRKLTYNQPDVREIIDDSFFSPI